MLELHTPPVLCQVSPASLATRDDVLVDPKERWAQWLAEGGDAESSRKAWIDHYIAGHCYAQVRTLYI